MKRSRLPLLAVLPVVVLSTVAASSLAFGDHPVRWESGSLLPSFGRGSDDPGTQPVKASKQVTERTDGDGQAADALRVDKPWKPGMPQWGVQIYWEDSPENTAAEVERRARQKAEYLVGLHANSVAVSFPFFTKGPTSTKLFAGDKTPTPEHMDIVLKVFQDAGLRVTMRPLMDEKSLNPPKGWRGNIAPASRDDWFASYRTFLKPYVALAQKHEVRTFVIGAELNSLEGDPRWSSLAGQLEKTFKGELSYDANWDNYVSGRIDMPVNHLGVDAYFPLQVPDTASVGTLVKGWERWLDKKTTGPLPRIVLSEAGIGAMKGAYRAPGDFYNQRAVDENVQANWYEAVCKVVVDRKMAGVYWWSINFDDDPDVAPGDDISRLHFAGRPKTEQVIRDCFGSDYQGPGAAAAP
ncbi:glycoside hydrolase family 113 [Streptomyces mesophilus]|uniref:glycoside hydrolase family 113 n=1 Tax=Streptomyces mesophilus TaxID=1775132 RepID=UPI00331B8C94